MDAIFRPSGLKLIPASLLFLIGGCDLDAWWSSDCDSWSTQALLEQVIDKRAGERANLYEFTQEGYSITDIQTEHKNKAIKHSICTATLVSDMDKDDPRWSTKMKPAKITYTSQMVADGLRIRITKGLP